MKMHKTLIQEVPDSILGADQSDCIFLWLLIVTDANDKLDFHILHLQMFLSIVLTV